MKSYAKKIMTRLAAGAMALLLAVGTAATDMSVYAAETKTQESMAEKRKITGFADEIAPELTAQIAGLKGLGMSYVEMRGVDGENLIYHTDEKVAQIKKTLDENGIRLSALGSPLGKILITDDFTPHFEEFKRAVEISHKMECPTIRMFSFYLPQESDPAAYEGEVFDRIGKFVDYASANDTLLLHENEKDIYGAMAPECKKLMDTFYGDHFKAIFDFANFVQCGQDTLEAYEMLKSYIAYIHVKDAMWEDGMVVPAGMGDVAIYTELGRFMMGPYGCLVTTAIHEKHTHKEYIGVDACAVDLMRPAMYGAYHHITVMGKEDAPHDHKYDVTGSLCENNDKFAIDRMLPEIEKGDYLVIHDTGAHGFAMGYSYNGKLKHAELLLKEDGSVQMIRRAERPADYFATFDCFDIGKKLIKN